MKVTYIAHSGFAVETEAHVLVFDYWRGALPECVSEDGREVVFFVSHWHEDHYGRGIYELASRKNVRYVLSREVRGAPAGADVTAVRPNAEYEAAGCRVVTLRSTDCGVAFLVTVDGRALYHAGDLHLWVWDRALPEQNRAMERAFSTEIAKLRGIKIDAAFLPLDPRQGADGGRGFDTAMRTLDIDRAFPMHFWGNADYVDAFVGSDAASEYRKKIVPLTEEGTCVEI